MMEIPKKYSSLSQLERRWKKYNITGLDILNLAIEGELLFSVWFNGETLSLRDGVTEEEIINSKSESLVSGFNKEMVYLPRLETMAFLSKDKVSVSLFLHHRFSRSVSD